MTRVVMAAGGTGGHVFPALAVAEELRSRGVEVTFVGSSGGMESRVVPERGFALEVLGMQALRGSGWRGWLALPARLGRALAAAIGLLRRLRPSAVVAMGGYAAAPVGLAAGLMGRRLVVHEQNAVPGLTNRLLRPFARAILTGFPEAAEALGRKAEWVGTPVRGELSPLAETGERTGDREGPLRVLAFGGSQGARFLNERLPMALARARPAIGLTVRHQAGRGRARAVLDAYGEAGVEADVTPFIDDMRAALAWCDLAFCRAGASTVAELASMGVPAVLVPFPHAVDDHQRRNAEALVSRGAAVCIPQSEWDDEAVAARLDGDLGDRTVLARMGDAARGFARPDAAARVADACEGRGL